MATQLRLYIHSFFYYLVGFFLLFPTFSFAARPMIVDTDAAIDDAIAILYLLSRPSIDVKAITIAATGEAHCDAALRNIHGLLKLADQKDLPIACGRNQPLVGNHHFPKWISDSADTMLGMSKFLPIQPYTTQQTAFHLLERTLAQSKHKVDILAIGPLTNLAEIIQKRPNLKAKIGRIYIMGGAVHVPGNLYVEKSIKNKKAEWNFYIDPTAAKIVFESNIPITLVPLDVTNKLPIDETFYQRLNSLKPHTPVGFFINNLFQQNKTPFLTWGWYFWDPLAAVIAADDSIAFQKNKKLRILVTPENLSGAIIEDKRNGNDISVCEEVPAEKFEMIALKSLFSV